MYTVNIFILIPFTFKLAKYAENIWVKGVEKWLVSVCNGLEKWLVSFRNKAKHNENSITKTD